MTNKKYTRKQIREEIKDLLYIHSEIGCCLCKEAKERLNRILRKI